MPGSFEHLLSPFRIRNVEFRNRVMVSAHLTCFAADGMPTEEQAAYFAERAKGGVALIVMALNIVHKNSYLWRAVEAAFDDAIVPNYRILSRTPSTSMAQRFSVSLRISAVNPGACYRSSRSSARVISLAPPCSRCRSRRNPRTSKRSSSPSRTRPRCAS